MILWFSVQFLNVELKSYRFYYFVIKQKLTDVTNKAIIKKFKKFRLATIVLAITSIKSKSSLGIIIITELIITTIVIKRQHKLNYQIEESKWDQNICNYKIVLYLVIDLTWDQSIRTKLRSLNCSLRGSTKI